MNKIYEKGVTRNQQASSHTPAILMSMLRVCLEYGWSMARVWLGAAKEQQRSSKGAVKEQQRSSLEVAWSMAKVCLRYAYAIPTRFLRPFSSKRAELERRLTISMLLMLTLGSISVWGQSGTDYSGIFYLVNGGSGKTSPDDPMIETITDEADYFYLVPADAPKQTYNRDAWYSSSDTNGDSEKPYLTTYKTKKDAAAVPDGVTNRPHNSVWIVKFASTDSGTDYYYLIHAATGKYVVYEPPFSSKFNRKSVHLLKTDSPDENAKFAVTAADPTRSSYYNFRPKSRTSGNRFLNASNRNFNYYYSHSNVKDGGVVDYYEGLIGLYLNKKNDKKNDASASDWVPVATLLDAPTISVVDANNKVTIEDANSLPSGYVIRYTTDGSTPTASTGEVYSGPIPITASVTIKAVVVRYGMVLTEVASEVREPVPCATPVITYDNTTSEVSITCATTGSTIYYTIDGSEPTASSTKYTSPFSVTSTTTVKAIASHATMGTSAVAELAISQVATPTIQNNGSNAISITTTTADATIYYTTDGSTPTTLSTVYSSPLTENVSNVTIKAIAVKENMITSAVGSGSVKLQCATPVITREGLTFTLSCSEPTDAILYYTLGGGPEVAYPGTPVSFDAALLPMTVTAVARHNDYTESETASMELKNGSGTPNDPYLIYGSTDFTDFVTNVNNGTTASACYKLGSDVSASGTDAITTTFTGTFDGDGYTISDLEHALFNSVNGGTVKNVILDNVSISGNDNGNAGAICCEATGDTRIYNCGVLASSSTVAKDEDGYDKITSCSSSISGSHYAGSIVGLLDGSARVINCFSYANVSGGTVGGIVGYNNVATTASNLKTMVMNCMYYGEVSGTSIAPIYNGEKITNDGDENGVNNFNYFRLESSYIENTTITKVYNCALGAETRFLQRFEFFRHLLNSNRELAAWWATGSTDNKDEMMKWILEPSQIGSSTPYPILKTPYNDEDEIIKYPSVVNIDAENAPLSTERNKGGKLGTLSVTIQSGNGEYFNAPSGASITKNNLTLNITDKDFDHFNFNYYKVQLPYYNEIGTGNYTENRVVTGWKIVSVTTDGSVTSYNSFATGEDAPAYNFADRKCTAKDIYSKTNKRVFNQGAYWDVPEGVTGITIQPYWGKAVYLSDAYWDVTYKNSSTDAMVTPVNVDNVGGGQHYGNGETFNSQTVYTSISDAIATKALYDNISEATYSARSVYDYAVVLVGNYHYTSSIAAGGKPYTLTSVDMDGDNEPDYSIMLRFNGRTVFHPVRYDFLNILGLGMAQKTTGGTGSYNLGIIQPKYWFESTNTSLFHVTQFEYDRSDRGAVPYIVQGGVMEQWVSGQNNGAANNTIYFHVGGNVWFKEFHRGTHQDKNLQSKHPPVSVTGGDYDEFYLTGLYTANVANYEDNAECYINGGRFGVVAGAAMEGIGKANGADDTGNITWQVQNADIKEFYAGGINAAKPVTGNLSTTITGGKIDLFCGGPKFGDMSTGKTVTTNATDCIFGTFFGAGYGGNSYSRQAPRNHNNLINFPHNDKDAGNHNSWNDWLDDYYKQSYNATYGGVSTQFSYQFLPMSGNVDNCARIFVEYVKFSLATCRNVTSTLTGCKITGNFYGGGSLGKVDGPVTSTLTNCEVQGNAFGAGFSASLPPVEVDNIGFETEPYYYTDLGTYRTGVKSGTVTYEWQHGSAIGIDKDNHILYTTENLDGLGAVTGKATLTIDGTTSVAESVYGGGEESAVGGSTEVNINGGTIGTDDSGDDYGNVFGGGNLGVVEKNTTVTISGGSVNQCVYGGGCEADVMGNTNVSMTDGYIFNGIFGGGLSGSVGTFTRSTAAQDVNIYGHTTHDGCIGKPVSCDEGTGKCTVVVSGGQIGPISVATQGMNRSKAEGGPVPEGWVWGAGRGLVEDPETHPDTHFTAYVNETDVTIEGNAFVLESIIGGGEFGRVLGDTNVKIKGGQIGVGANQTKDGKPLRYSDDKFVDPSVTQITDDNALEPCSHYQYGKTVGTTTVYETYDPYADEYKEEHGSLPTGFEGGSTDEPSDGKTWIGCVFGGGSGYFPYKKTDTDGKIIGYGWVESAGWVEGNANLTISGGHILSNVYGANEYTTVQRKSTVTMTGGTIGVPRTQAQIDANPKIGHLFGGGKGDPRPYFNNKTNAGSVEVAVSGGIIYGSVFGGGESGTVKGGVTVSMTGGVVLSDVYGGGALADTQTDNWDATKNSGTGGWATGKTSASSTTTVRLTGGNILGEAYGGGLGETGSPAYVYGDVLLDLNGTTTSGEEDTAIDADARGCAVHEVFGCNNAAGSPMGAVTVHVYATQNKAKSQIGNTDGETPVTDAKVKGSYDVTAVYGGGNLAAYEPAGGKETTNSTNVIIDGCELTSIQTVYGGGNAASTPATNVIVNGTFEIEELFGGGNGKDKLSDGRPNPGANVGYKNYTIYKKVNDEWVAEDDPAYDTKEERTASTSGITYGTGQASINVFGGTVHRVFGGSNTKGNVRQTAVTLLDENSGCDFCVDEAYGGGKSAPMDAEAKLLMACIPGLQAAYGGAEAAAIKGNVTLNITNGTFDRVFGGNNKSGTIDGSITVNIEEVGCRPIIIGELYGGGNLAGYSVYGYDSNGIPIEPGDTPLTPLYNDPQVNVKSFTSIGKVFGGGYGSGATMVGNPTVNVNEVYGRYYNDDRSIVAEGAETPNHYPIPSHAKGKMGAISEVFGGGNAAPVKGNTTVNIATKEDVSIRSFEVKSVTVGESVEGLYTRSGDGTAANPYTFTPATGTAVEGTTYYEEKEVEKKVLGVDIRGNVYGGGNNAQVTGNAVVNVGKKVEE